MGQLSRRSGFVVMDNIRCTPNWCKGPTNAWMAAVAAQQIREHGCQVSGCCEGWCWGELRPENASEAMGNP